MSCSCPRDPNEPGICDECADDVAAGLCEASIGVSYRPQRIMELMETQAELAWDLGVSLPKGHPFAPSVAGRQAA